MNQTPQFHIDADIRQAWTLPSSFYTDPQVFAASRDRVFARSWQFAGSVDRLRDPTAVLPIRFLDGHLEEPLVLSRDENGHLRCLSNVCTHRGNLVCEAAGRRAGLRCRYHGRSFSLDGRFRSMPEFEEAADFPTAADDLKELPLGEWKSLLFTALDPSTDFATLTAPLEERLGWMPVDRFKFAPERSRDYEVNAHWALYCDNYLEGFHIPFVHKGLAAGLDYGAYTTEISHRVSLQIGVALEGEPCFALPDTSPDAGRPIAAYYFFLFPNTLLNFYPWGLSVNIVQPLTIDRTRIRYRSYVWKPELLDFGAGGALDKVEMEDEEIVESVQRGVRSRIYSRGRFSPTREQAVHHFHRMLAEAFTHS